MGLCGIGQCKRAVDHRPDHSSGQGWQPLLGKPLDHGLLDLGRAGLHHGAKDQQMAVQHHVHGQLRTLRAPPSSPTDTRRPPSANDRTLRCRYGAPMKSITTSTPRPCVACATTA